jgi:IclR family KDG regulon transcriptional repressor
MWHGISKLDRKVIFHYTFFIPEFKNAVLYYKTKVSPLPIIQAVERALLILDLFQDQQMELKITEISARMSLHKSTVHSLLKTLQLYQYIEQNPANGCYRLGMKLVERGQYVLSNLDLRNVAAPVLQQLTEQTGQTSNLVILEGKEGIYIDKVEGAQAVIRYSRIGRKIPLHCSAVGKVLLAFQPAPKMEQILQNYTYVPHTEFTIESEERLRMELKQVTSQKFAIDHQENELGVRCLAAPVYDVSSHIVASISLSTLVSRVSYDQMLEMVPFLQKACAEISQRLGFKSVQKSSG